MWLMEIKDAPEMKQEVVTVWCITDRWAHLFKLECNQGNAARAKDKIQWINDSQCDARLSHLTYFAPYMAFCWFMLKVSCLGQMGLSGGGLKWYTRNSGFQLGFTANCPAALPPLLFPETNLWLLLAMVAREQVDNDTGPQCGNQRAPVIEDFGLLPHHHLQQKGTKSQPPTAHIRSFTLHEHLAAKITAQAFYCWWQRWFNCQIVD